MTVECPSCGQVVQIPSFPGWCPACNRRITSLVPPLTSKRPSPSGQAPESAPASSPSTRGLEELASTERPLPYVEPRQRRPINVMLWVKVGVAVVLLIGTFVLVNIVVGKTRAFFAARTAATTTKSTPVAPAPPPPQTAPANSVFHEPAQSPTPPPPFATAPAVPVITIAPPIAPKRVEDPPDTVTDKAIEQAIQRGATYLIEQVQSGSLEPAAGDAGEQMEGRFAICVLALLHAGQATFDQRLNMSGELMPMLLERLKKLPMNENYSTYARSVRSLALAVHGRRVDRAAMSADLDYLLKSSMRGAYNYVMPKSKEEREVRRYDNSNTQYAVLGAWAAADAGLPVPHTFWQEAEEHWTKDQLPNGAWPYVPGTEPRMTMTAGGVTSLFVAGDQLSAGRAASGVDAAPYKPALQRGLDWLAQGDNSINLNIPHAGYAMYGLERAGLASGFKRFGKHDWFRAIAAKVLSTQEEDGSWTGNDGPRPETSFRVLFLSRGRHPIMMNKLRFDGAWANRPRDVARLADFVFDSIERPVNWQVVNLSEGWTEWIDAPIAYLASHAPPPLTDENVKQLRGYVEAGGLLFTHADVDAKEFNDFAEQLAKAMFPQYEMRDLPPDHAVYSMIYKVTGEKAPPLRGLSNGARLLMIHSPTDLSGRWQNRPSKTQPIPFQLGANLFVYATGKGVLRNRLDTPLVPETPGDPLATFTVARVKHSGHWDPEPGAWPRMAKWFRRETNVALNVVPTEAAALRRTATPFAHLTTTSPWKPSEKELVAIRNFVSEGGLLLLDPCGGAQDLAVALQRDVAQAAFLDQTARDVDEKDQFIGGTGAGMENLAKPLMRVYAVEQLGNKLPTMQIMPVGRGWIVISKLDLISGLLGSNTWGILGYDPNYAQPLMKNLILFACNGRTFVVPPPSTAPAVQPPPDPGGPS